MNDPVTIGSVGDVRRRYLERFHDNDVLSQNNPMSLIVVVATMAQHRRGAR